MKSTIVKDRQTMFDIAIRECGDCESAFALSLLNGKNITDKLIDGDVLLLPDIQNGEIVNSYTLQKLEPATSITTEQKANTIANEGIEFWAVEVDFVVS